MKKEILDMQMDTLQMADEYMPKLKNGINIAIKHFQDGNSEEGIGISSFIEEGLQWLVEVARLTKDIQSDKMDENILQAKIDIFAEAYENEDYTLMGDILEFEISPLIAKWEIIIKNIIRN